MKYQRLFISFVICFCVTMALQTSQIEASNIISENSRTQTLQCNGSSYEILGNKNRLTLTGECDKIGVRGNWNVVSVEAVNAIQVTGNSNEVRWGRALKGDEPEIVNVGSKNNVIAGLLGAPSENKSSSQEMAAETSGSQKEVTEQPQIQIKTSGEGSNSKQVEISGSNIRVKRTESTNPNETKNESEVIISGSDLSVKGGGKAITIVEDNENKTIDCGQGGSLVVSGDENTLKVNGQCSSLVISGNDNTITIDMISKIKIAGDKNQIYWKNGFGSGEPKIEDIGSKNSIYRLQK